MRARPKLIGSKDRLIPPEERDRVLAFLKADHANDQEGPQHALARLAILLADQAGLRISEIVHLQQRDCDVQRKPYRLLIRGSKHRAKDYTDEQPIGGELAVALRPYCMTGSKALKTHVHILGLRRVAYSRQHILTLVKAVHHACDVSEIHGAHSWRHGYGTRIYLETKDLVLTSRMLRHRSTKPTERYVHMASAMEEMDEVLAAVAATSKQRKKSPKTPRKKSPKSPQRRRARKRKAKR